MTLEEAMDLQPGDVVEFRDARYRDRWFEVVVERVEPGKVYARRRTAGRSGRRNPVIWREPGRCRSLAPPDNSPAHVYAGWLETHGYPEAGRALRRAFPMAGRPVPVTPLALFQTDDGVPFVEVPRPEPELEPEPDTSPPRERDDDPGEPSDVIHGVECWGCEGRGHGPWLVTDTTGQAYYPVCRTCGGAKRLVDGAAREAA